HGIGATVGIAVGIRGGGGGAERGVGMAKEARAAVARDPRSRGGLGRGSGVEWAWAKAARFAVARDPPSRGGLVRVPVWSGHGEGDAACCSSRSTLAGGLVRVPAWSGHGEGDAG